MALGTGVYGTNNSNAVFNPKTGITGYGLPSVTGGTRIAASTWTAVGQVWVYQTGTGPQGQPILSSTFVFNGIVDAVNAERGRRGYATVSLPITNPVQASQFNAVKAALEVVGPAASQAYNTSGTITITTYPQSPAPSGATAVAPGQAITATSVNALITELNNAGAVCTCNCNYCTCNCNYACTCNCNYSDKRLKDNIAFIGVKAGVNVYSFTYLADNSTTYVGAMAQDLLKSKYASAVSVDKNGYYTVDYSKLPIKFKIKK